MKPSEFRKRHSAWWGFLLGVASPAYAIEWVIKFAICWANHEAKDPK